MIDINHLRSLALSMNDRQIAAHLGISFNTVRKIRYKNGIPACPKDPAEFFGGTEKLRELATTLSDEELAAKFDCCRSRVTHARKLCNIPSYTEFSGERKWTAKAGRPFAEVDPYILKKLCKEFSDEEIAKQLGLARVTVTLARQRYSIPSFTESSGLRRRNSEVYQGGKPREVFFNERFFEELNDEASAYFLGLLAADGCVHNNRVELMLKANDKHILSRFIEVIGGSDNCVVRSKICKRRGEDILFSRVSLCSKVMAQDLATWGILPNKSLTLTLLRPVPKHLLSHFIRGYWDGNGHIGERHFSVGCASLNFTTKLIAWIQEIGGSAPTCNKRLTYKGNPFYNISVNRKNLHRFRDFLYENATIYLNRKHEAYRTYWC